jgi:hypothetical protein
VCDVGAEHTGECVAPDDGCVITGASSLCGDALCGPGTACSASGKCLPDLPCRTAHCDQGTCWGEDCSCARPPPACAPAPLGAPGDAGTLNDFSFTRCGSLASCDGGIVALGFDTSCNAWAVTIISGPDYLREIKPGGEVKEYTGVSNLDMGEVAAIQGKDGQFGGPYGDVALTYTCQSGCTPGPDGSQQGVAALDAAAGMLPMKIPSPTPTTGAGPFGDATYDAGPFGLTWGLDRVLYVGNSSVNGDFVALDLAGGGVVKLVDLPARVHAAAPYDAERMAVATEGGQVYLVPALGVPGAVQPLATLPANATSLARDSWSGRVYAELQNQDIVSFRADGKPPVVFQKAPGIGRVTVGPDGFLYHVTVGYQLGKSEITRWELPKSLP